MEITFNNKYKSVKLIGKGEFGIIYKVLEIGTNNFYALKFINFININEIKIFEENYKNEIEIVKNIKNKYIIELKDYFIDKIHQSYCIVMELCDCDLRDILDKYKPNGLPINIIEKIFIQLNEALKIMQKKKYYHKNLKPENILIKYTDKNKTNFDIKLTDFGLSSNEMYSNFEFHTNVGTFKIYKAPEVDDFKFNNKIDLWSLGIILYELYTNKYIFQSENPIKRINNRVKGRIEKETDNEMINKLIRKLIQVDINKRIGWEEYFNDDFFKIKKEKEMEIIFNKKYKAVDIIGRGGFGIIYKVLEIGTNNFYALKLITIFGDNNNEIEKFKKAYEKEIEFMRNIKNKYIIELKDYFIINNKGYCIVMELCDCNLKNILDKYKPNGLPINIIEKIFIQLNEALKIMRKKNYYHRDLKPENILIKYTDKTNFDIKLTDFGLSSNEITSSAEYYTNIGTEKYRAPEVDDFKFNNKIDLWSLGIILYELYTNKYIFQSENKRQEVYNRFEGRIEKETDNEMINKLIRKLIQVDINKRIGWEEYFNDDFFK